MAGDEKYGKRCVAHRKGRTVDVLNGTDPPTFIALTNNGGNTFSALF